MYDGRIQDVADENFGPFPVQSDEEAMTAIERGIFELRQRLATAEAATRQSDAWYRTALTQAERYDQESRAALADAAALRERVGRLENELRGVAEDLGGECCSCEAYEATGEPCLCGGDDDCNACFATRLRQVADGEDWPARVLAPTDPDGASEAKEK
jgi:hypothetical protein